MATKKPTARPSVPAFERPLVTVDVVIFTVIDEQLKVLLVRRPETAADPYPGRMALPGGFINVDVDASLHDCALRKLEEKTGLKSPYLEQLGSWGSATRDPRGWCATHVYFALVPPPGIADAAGLEVTAASAASEWIEVDTALRKRLAFDHAEILAAAVERLRGKVEYTSLPAFLLEEPFTLPQLQRTYEIVLGRPMDKSAFRKRMLDAQFLAEAGSIAGDAGRVAMGYRILDRERAAVFPRTFRSVEVQSTKD
ncbi:MAG: NUDIX domain-containing protein [Hydrogenophaga sp.]|nr:NUDIX domain-containing protein [Hydrogenophaga sp.]